MPKFIVFCDPATLEGEYEADDRESAIETALDDWCSTFGQGSEAIGAGTFDVRLVPE